jgi:hypothetical protein
MSLFFKPKTNKLWDTWVFYYAGTFFLYFLVARHGEENFFGVGLATSNDGVHWHDRGVIIEKEADAIWLGSGAVWPSLRDRRPDGNFIMNFSEFRDGPRGGNQTIFFAESADLIHWTRLGRDFEFVQDGRWYESNGRWDNLWTVPRPGGGYYGYWAATPKDGLVGIGYGESADGRNWVALHPAILTNVPIGPELLRSPEVGAVYEMSGRYYALPGLDDLRSPVGETFLDFRPGHTTFVSERPEGPFQPAAKNRRVLVGNASYFLRFIETPFGVLANHHSWISQEGAILQVKEGSACVAPLKRAEWDEDGTLRLRWWENNDAVKSQPLALFSEPHGFRLSTDESYIIEGVVNIDTEAAGICLQGESGCRTVYSIREGGAVDFGDLRVDGSSFESSNHVDRELRLSGTVTFRLLLCGRITEFYINDYLMQCYCLPRACTIVTSLGDPGRFSELSAWRLEGPAR